MDDAFQIHERLGGSVFAPAMTEFFGRTSRFGLKFKDYGELGVSIFFSSLIFIGIGISHYRSHNDDKKISKYLFIMLVFLAFFGITVDMVHEHYWIKQSHILVRQIFGMVEDSGEMLIMSVITWFVFSQNKKIINRNTNCTSECVKPDI